VGEKDELIDLYYNSKEKNLGMVSTHFSEFSENEIANCVSLDNYFRQSSIKKVDFIKIDIEGYEFSALLGMKNILLKFHPILLIEILEDNKQLSTNKKTIIDFLEDIEYKQYFIDGKGNLSKTEINHSRMNYIFTKKNLLTTPKTCA
tara:strand:+ start:9059 stop:9499 length:441 start_codon:yes stop_codon:yes gene_type:complete